MAPKPKTDGPPSDAQVRRALGPARAAWDALLDPGRGRAKTLGEGEVTI